MVFKESFLPNFEEVPMPVLVPRGLELCFPSLVPWLPNVETLG